VALKNFQAKKFSSEVNISVAGRYWPHPVGHLQYSVLPLTPLCLCGDCGDQHGVQTGQILPNCSSWQSSVEPLDSCPGTIQKVFFMFLIFC